MAKTSLHVRVDRELKNEAAQILGHFGLSTSQAVRYFLHRVVASRSFPLELKVPNAETRAAMAEGDELIKAYLSRCSAEEELFNDDKENNCK